VATDLRGGASYNSVFLLRSFLNLTVKKNYENWSTFAEVIIKISGTFFETWCSFYSGTNLGEIVASI